MIGKSGLAAAMLTTWRIPSSTDPGLNATCPMPAAFRPSIISTALSVRDANIGRDVLLYLRHLGAEGSIVAKVGVIP